MQVQRDLAVRLRDPREPLLEPPGRRAGPSWRLPNANASSTSFRRRQPWTQTLRQPSAPRTSPTISRDRFCRNASGIRSATEYSPSSRPSRYSPRLTLACSATCCGGWQQVRQQFVIGLQGADPLTGRDGGHQSAQQRGLSCALIARARDLQAGRTAPEPATCRGNHAAGRQLGKRDLGQQVLSNHHRGPEGQGRSRWRVTENGFRAQASSSGARRRMPLPGWHWRPGTGWPRPTPHPNPPPDDASPADHHRVGSPPSPSRGSRCSPPSESRRRLRGVHAERGVLDGGGVGALQRQRPQLFAGLAESLGVFANDRPDHRPPHHPPVVIGHRPAILGRPVLRVLGDLLGGQAAQGHHELPVDVRLHLLTALDQSRAATTRSWTSGITRGHRSRHPPG